MVRDIEELEEILDGIQKKVFLANRMDTLDELLVSWGFSEYVEPSAKSEHYSSGKIVVIGASEVKESVLSAICKDKGIDKCRLEFCLDYEKAQKFDYKKMHYNPSYCAVIFGAVPHSTMDRGDSRSIIAQLESQKGYPRVKRLVAGNDLKITKSNFKKAIDELLETNVISADY